MKDLIVIGGPNGAGKTTSAMRLLPADLKVMEFVNADEIAHGLSPFNPERYSIAAARLMIERIRTLIRDGESFAFETTCAGRIYVQWLQDAQKAGYRLTLLYLWLPSPELAIERVARRVRDGGHHVPDDVVVRRYWTGLRNMLNLYLPVVDITLIVDNSDRRGKLIAESKLGELFVHDPIRWKRIRSATND